MGLFSVLDAILDRPMHEVLDQIPIEDDVKAALLGEPGRLRDVYDVGCAHLSGDWEVLARRCERLDLAIDRVPALAHAALVRCEAAPMDDDARAA